MVAVASSLIDAVRVGSSEVAAIYIGSSEAWTANKPGMVLINPTSIAYSGTSASVGANGQVTFSAVTSLSLNGVFTAGFDNYVVAYNVSASSDRGVAMRFRASGSDASGSDYTWQLLQAESTTVEGARASSQTSGRIYYTDVIEESANTIAAYGPFLTQPTAYRSVVTGFRDGAGLYNFAGTHSLSTSYDGFTLITISPVAGITGKLAVYGVRS